MKPRWRLFFLTIPTGMLFLLATHLAWAQDPSHARIVRLSFVEGGVTVERPDMQVWAEAPVNTPLQEGFKVSTGENGFAELQFENGDTIRLGETSLLALTQLGQTDTGNINRLDIRNGYATVHTWGDNQNDVLELTTPQGALTARGSALFRVDLDKDIERVEVFQGTVDVRSNLGRWNLESDTVLVLEPRAAEPGEVTRGITEDDWDHWVEERDNPVETAQTGPSPNSDTGDDSNTVAGWNELLQYGDWSYLSGVGYGWMPTQVGPGWAPYSTGRWFWYPNWGYTWIAAEPWGWLPFHYGVWDFVPGTGWVWFPGNLERWSPAAVNWYQGPGWIGWSPRRPRPVVGGPAHRPCATAGDCGGMAMSISAFRSGGRVNPAVGLAFSPTAGERIKQPQLQPTTAMMLPGPAAPRSAAVSGEVTVRSGNVIQLGAGARTTVPEATTARHVSVAPPDSNIVYDPQAASYVNSQSLAPSEPSAPPQAGARVTPTRLGGPIRISPAPGAPPEGSPRPAYVPGSFQTGPEKPAVTWGAASPRPSTPPTAQVAVAPATTVQRPAVSGGGIESSRTGGGAASAHGGGVPPGAVHR